ncbi:flagellar M-ring protein FliF [Erythrobacter sp. LQ02-29]|uniref:flagellar basal-body MS-ring/collar protein FliF n=1 Tax=Erythrobacter sp. LQ02-29 TaxID=2920384 RepID=UPI001F4D37FC|nr:flagellar basal-body MS-ring/collar protein FliF [Erythrobacter sp. LQ02-29]MCP9221255.1 flagellar M-ring protein FliF [Erythrobacter sp. LQ02-29]
MADLVPSGAGGTALAVSSPTGAGASRASLLGAFTDPTYGSFGERLKAFTAQPAIRKSLPAIGVLGGLSALALLWVGLSQPPQRVLYGSLSDSERAEVASALDTGGIDYTIDNTTGMLTVGEDDLYRARMLVASNGALAAPESTSEMLDAIPLGSSRTLEGERVRNVRERELMMTIMEIDGVEAVRVHLATPERSVFVREQSAPSASVMVRMARGRNLSPDQVVAIGNLVAASVPGMSADAVRIVDQHGKLLSNRSTSDGSVGLDLQRQFEEKLRAQIAQLLVPIVGEGNFSSEVQVELDLNEMTSAQENYDKDGALRSETQSRSQQSGAGPAGGVPGVLANTPPAPNVLEEGPPQDTQVAGNPETSGESSARRTYELGRQVQVTTTTPGAVRRLSVAVALSSEALKTIKPASVKQIENLVAAAVGANPDRGDKVTVISSAFDPAVTEAPPFYETAWFGTILRNGIALLAVILGLIFGVRPLLRNLRRDRDEDEDADDTDSPEQDSESMIALRGATTQANLTHESVREQVELARRLAVEQPDQAAATLRRMLAAPVEAGR